MSDASLEKRLRHVLRAVPSALAGLPTAAHVSGESGDHPVDHSLVVLAGVKAKCKAAAADAAILCLSELLNERVLERCVDKHFDVTSSPHCAICELSDSAEASKVATVSSLLGGTAASKSSCVIGWLEMFGDKMMLHDGSARVPVVSHCLSPGSIGSLVAVTHWRLTRQPSDRGAEAASGKLTLTVEREPACLLTWLDVAAAQIQTGLSPPASLSSRRHALVGRVTAVSPLLSMAAGQQPATTFLVEVEQDQQVQDASSTAAGDASGGAPLNSVTGSIRHTILFEGTAFAHLHAYNLLLPGRTYLFTGLAKRTAQLAVEDAVGAASSAAAESGAISSSSAAATADAHPAVSVPLLVAQQPPSDLPPLTAWPGSTFKPGGQATAGAAAASAGSAAAVLALPTRIALGPTLVVPPTMLPVLQTVIKGMQTIAVQPRPSAVSAPGEPSLVALEDGKARDKKRRKHHGDEDDDGGSNTIVASSSLPSAPVNNAGDGASLASTSLSTAVPLQSASFHGTIVEANGETITILQCDRGGLPSSPARPSIHYHLWLQRSPWLWDGPSLSQPSSCSPLIRLPPGCTIGATVLVGNALAVPSIEHAYACCARTSIHVLAAGTTLSPSQSAATATSSTSTASIFGPVEPTALCAYPQPMSLPLHIVTRHASSIVASSWRTLSSDAIGKIQRRLVLGSEVAPAVTPVAATVFSPAPRQHPVIEFTRLLQPAMGAYRGSMSTTSPSSVPVTPTLLLAVSDQIASAVAASLRCLHADLQLQPWNRQYEDDAGTRHSLYRLACEAMVAQVAAMLRLPPRGAAGLLDVTVCRDAVAVSIDTRALLRPVMAATTAMPAIEHLVPPPLVASLVADEVGMGWLLADSNTGISVESGLLPALRRSSETITPAELPAPASAAADADAPEPPLHPRPNICLHRGVPLSLHIEVVRVPQLPPSSSAPAAGAGASSASPADGAVGVSGPPPTATVAASDQLLPRYYLCGSALPAPACLAAGAIVGIDKLSTATTGLSASSGCALTSSMATVPPLRAPVARRPGWVDVPSSSSSPLEHYPYSDHLVPTRYRYRCWAGEAETPPSKSTPAASASPSNSTLAHPAALPSHHRRQNAMSSSQTLFLFLPIAPAHITHMVNANGGTSLAGSVEGMMLAVVGGQPQGRPERVLLTSSSELHRAPPPAMPHAAGMSSAVPRVDESKPKQRIVRGSGNVMFGDAAETTSSAMRDGVVEDVTADAPSSDNEEEREEGGNTTALNGLTPGVADLCIGVTVQLRLGDGWLAAGGSAARARSAAAQPVTSSSSSVVSSAADAQLLPRPDHDSKLALQYGDRLLHLPSAQLDAPSLSTALDTLVSSARQATTLPSGAPRLLLSVRAVMHPVGELVCGEEAAARFWARTVLPGIPPPVPADLPPPFTMVGRLVSIAADPPDAMRIERLGGQAEVDSAMQSEHYRRWIGLGQPDAKVTITLEHVIIDGSGTSTAGIDGGVDTVTVFLTPSEYHLPHGSLRKGVVVLLTDCTRHYTGRGHRVYCKSDGGVLSVVRDGAALHALSRTYITVDGLDQGRDGAGQLPLPVVSSPADAASSHALRPHIPVVPLWMLSSDPAWSGPCRQMMRIQGAQVKRVLWVGASWVCPYTGDRLVPLPPTAFLKPQSTAASHQQGVAVFTYNGCYMVRDKDFSERMTIGLTGGIGGNASAGAAAASAGGFLPSGQYRMPVVPIGGSGQGGVGTSMPGLDPARTYTTPLAVLAEEEVLRSAGGLHALPSPSPIIVTRRMTFRLECSLLIDDGTGEAKAHVTDVYTVLGDGRRPVDDVTPGPVSALLCLTRRQVEHWQAAAAEFGRLEVSTWLASGEGRDLDADEEEANRLLGIVKPTTPAGHSTASSSRRGHKTAAGLTGAGAASSASPSPYDPLADDEEADGRYWAARRVMDAVVTAVQTGHAEVVGSCRRAASSTGARSGQRSAARASGASDPSSLQLLAAIRPPVSAHPERTWTVLGYPSVEAACQAVLRRAVGAPREESPPHQQGVRIRYRDAAGAGLALRRLVVRRVMRAGRSFDVDAARFYPSEYQPPPPDAKVQPQQQQQPSSKLSREVSWRRDAAIRHWSPVLAATIRDAGTGAGASSSPALTAVPRRGTLLLLPTAPPTPPVPPPTFTRRVRLGIGGGGWEDAETRTQPKVHVKVVAVTRPQ